MRTLYRKYIREVLLLTAPYPMTERALMDSVDELIAGPLDVSEFRDAMEWNLGKDYIRAERNEDSDLEEWRLTRKGMAKAKEL